MTSKIDDLLPPAKEFMKKLALAEMEEAAKQAHKDAERRPRSRRCSTN